MSSEQNQALYRRFIDEIFNADRLDRLDTFVAPDYALRDAPPGTPAGPDAIRQIVTLFRGAFRDLNISIEEIVAEGNTVCARATTRGTHTGTFFNIPGSGKRVAMSGLTMVHIVNGRLTESWVRNDVAGLMSQIGV